MTAAVPHASRTLAGNFKDGVLMSTPAFPQRSTFPALIKRRRAMAVASAAIGIAGCTATQAPTAQAPVPKHQLVADQVRRFTSDVELGLDPVDRDRLRAAAEKKNASANTNSATAPAAGQVILASAGGEAQPTGHASEPAAHAGAPAGHSKEPAAHASESPAGAVTPHTAENSSVSAESKTVGESKPAAEPPHAAPVQATASEKALPALDKTLEKTPVQATAEASASPLSSKGNEEIRSAVITPVATPTPTPAAAMGAMNAVASAQGAAVMTPAPVTGAPTAEPSVEEALATLKKNVGTHPTLSTSLALALLDGNSAADAAKDLSESDQKVFNDLLSALETMKTASPSASLSDRAAPLLDAAKKWQADQDLSLPRLVLASRVDSFGVFTPVEPVFEQGKRRTVIIYCEVANFASQKGSDGWYTTHLTQQETLMTDDNLLVWRPNAEEVEDRSLNQRHDFYLVKKLTIPENLAAGKYSLVMNVTDKVSGKNNIVTLPIEIK